MKLILCIFCIFVGHIRNSWTIANQPSHWEYIKNEIYPTVGGEETVEKACLDDDTKTPQYIYKATQHRVYKYLFVMTFYGTSVVHKNSSTQSIIYATIKSSFDRISLFMEEKLIDIYDLEGFQSVLENTTLDGDCVLEIFKSIVKVVYEEFKNPPEEDLDFENDPHKEILGRNYDWEIYKSVIPDSVKNLNKSVEDLTTLELLIGIRDIQLSIIKEYTCDQQSS